MRSNYTNNRLKEAGPSSILLPLFFLIAIIAIGCFTIQKRINSDEYTMATRVEIKTETGRHSNKKMYSPIFYYNVNNQEYSCKTSSSSSIKPNITNYKVYYNSKNPSECISEQVFMENCFYIFISFIIALTVFIFFLIPSIIK